VAGLSSRILRQAARLERMADRLLDTCEIGAGRPSIERSETNLGQIVDDVVHAFAEPAHLAGSELVTSVRGSVVGHWDPIRVEQIVANLVDNAIKFGDGKPIHIDVEVNGERRACRFGTRGAEFRKRMRSTFSINTGGPRIRAISADWGSVSTS